MAKFQGKGQESQAQKEVKDTSCSIHSLNNDNASFASFEKHTKGIGMKLLTKMGYNGKAIGIYIHGIINPIDVRPQTFMKDQGMFKKLENSPKNQSQGILQV